MEYSKEKQLGPKKLKLPSAQKKKEATGEARMFGFIWQKRKHICENCKEALSEEPLVNYFSHIKPKSTHPELRLVESNIQLLCCDCHDAYDKQGIEAFEKRTK